MRKCIIAAAAALLPGAMVAPSVSAYEHCTESSPCHALTMYGQAQYGPEAKYFDYVNPNAPIQGEVTFAATGTFDSLNMFILKGTPAAGVSMMYDRLMSQGLDEPFTQYGRIAKAAYVAEDRSSVTFQLRPEARWHDGEPLTAEDVVFTFNTIMEKGHPRFRAYYRDIKQAEALDEHTVRFSFSNTDNRELPLIISQMIVLPEHFYTTGAANFEETTLTPPLGSGPYRVKSVDPGKSVTYERVMDYWGNDLPVQKGWQNFAEIAYDYYRDGTVAVEALKAGEYDLRQENIAKNWAQEYEGIKPIEAGVMQQEELANNNPTGMQAFAFNLRKGKFSDARVRRAIGYAFDFEWTNAHIFYDAYTRTNSYFSNSEFASSGLPSGDELALLEPYRDQLPDAVFTENFTVPKTDGSGQNRQQLRAAKKLLEEAGWGVKDGQLTHKTSGEVMEIEFLLYSPTFERMITPMLPNLKKLGITAKLRTIDTAQYIARVENWDYDLIISSFPQSNSPGNEQIDYWHSSKANVKGSRNVMGIEHPVVDALVEKVVAAQTRAELVTATRALDRVLLHHYYVIPQYHGRSYRLIYWDKFSRPAKKPYFDVGIDSWWVDEEKSAKVDDFLKNR